jgi:hypothetical protein
MKKLIYKVIVLTGVTLALTFASKAQTPSPHVYHVTTWTINMPENGSREEMDSLSKEYVEKVIKKNPLILHEWHFRHFFTDDNREYMIIDEYASMKDIEEASSKFDDLEKAAWTDTKKREAFLDRFNMYFNHHSDKVFAAVAGLTKEGPSSNEEHVFNFQTNYMKNTKMADRAKRDSLNREMFQKIDMKNDLLISQRHMTHFFTNDSHEYMVLTEYKSLSDMEAAFKKDEALVKATYSEEQTKKNDKQWSNYFSHHGDKLFHSIAGVGK